MPIELWTFLPLFFAAIGIGFLASLLGLGGGVFMVPLLSLGGFVATMPEAAGTSIAAISPTTAAARSTCGSACCSCRARSAGSSSAPG